ncbi:SUMF1/EgtB/PvdO family nonheme iron enzyme [Leclercia pneumoniae]|uniref:SUMF1/EgtB/PvdO family nonheme iron enzyme n=1 Tax=Leclercia pneumoniae TaxID=2815358 RepID=A0ABX8JS28_9ENTR|nr:SUMF1/EgtB/PvdO family nonheme iron enzyme [Leclercia pneumoniae]MCV2514369.1 SUMF1/EgtB/PvdO family nonheme iron enzyme [Leclercia pneumoniae]QSW35959.1 SUMF1/EgtB/PvdO family nonheme iron enzyme [Leclercia pneumoniae]QWW79121.1 SUMF1/EgtB/PvdO family nonheme iron enzyme [Leclercia pneumoniae]WNN81706.1 SUMF1/EgtB/PvdO family nonheme iron enzyme [Leclercia pneumoniae]
MKFKLALGLTLMGLGYSCAVQATWDEKFWNPKPLADDVILPMPCDGAMAFRKVAIPQNKPLEDYNITLGQEGDEWGYVEQARQEHIAGSFPDQKNKGRYYLMAKYELSDLQFRALSGECPKADMKGRLPKVNIGWMDAMAFANQYNLWLRKEKLAALPKDDGQPGFLRLPTETEWEFAARGGLAVSPSEFRDVHFPMPEGLNGYVWYAGAQSANGKLQLTGLLKPNPLGLHDILGNVAEMMFEPFRLNKLDRLHGKAGGYVVRGGSYVTTQGDIRSALRGEEPYYSESGENVSKTTGVRLVMVSTTLTSRDRVKEIEKEWQALGSEQKTDAKGKAPDSLQNLNALSAKVQDDGLKKELEKLRAELRANGQLRDEQRDQAIRTSLQLGAFLCTKMKDDGEFLDRLNQLYSKTCAADSQLDANCSRRQEQLGQHQKALDFISSYYADTLVDMGTTYNKSLIDPQIAVVQQQMAARGKTNLNGYLDTYWQNLQGYWKDGKVARDAWLMACKKNK